MIEADRGAKPRRPLRGCGGVGAGLLPYLEADWHLAWHVQCQTTGIRRMWS